MCQEGEEEPEVSFLAFDLVYTSVHNPSSRKKKIPREMMPKGGDRNKGTGEILQGEFTDCSD